ncbi:flagellar basal body P-ring formation chaperone FlgA [Rosenbergiella nectarea]|uniref:Flagella basal body P-ring formation protein FlgA n=1 Tax=Rosenbergiella nectarea TaxID=988801 RepID=A0A1H9LTB3_9GAMM|nr:flagellar basal body P-ring formation chaperone FlgA [Rosenbergiella nectarea]SER14509.1 flagella basal body P-ring formation protein FlgA [Rosenbergiella nectarea]
MKALWIAASLLMTTPAHAVPLADQLVAFFAQREPDYAKTLQVEILRQPPTQLTCSHPRFQLPSNSRRWGQLTLTAKCDQQVAVLRVAVKVKGKFYRSQQTIKQGTLVTADNIKADFGRLDQLPTNSWLTPLPLPLIALQQIPAGKVLTKNQFRQPWVIKQGQTVPITLMGKGFHIAGRGTALDNAAVNQPLRIRLDNGQWLTATVNERKEIIVK